LVPVEAGFYTTVSRQLPGTPADTLDPPRGHRVVAEWASPAVAPNRRRRKPMTDIVNEPPRAHVRIVYLGPVSPHWELYSDYGDRTVLEEFRTRVMARLVLLPRDDPQFRRNRERIVRDAERERISLEWDLGIPEGD
jgi:hypothetical protein